MTLNANSLRTNLLVTVLVALMVVILPWADRKICDRLGVNLHGGLSRNPRADHLLQVRKVILWTGFAVYLGIFAWLVFFSRIAAEDYQVHVAPLEDLTNSVQTDHGFSDVFRTLFSEGIGAALSRVRIVRLRDILQFYMNMMLFVPLGYLLPYISSWFRARVTRWPTLACFLFSFLVENLQLITRRGYYDLDDMISNTLGGFIGQTLFISVAFVVTYPGWRKELRSYRKWKKESRGHALPAYEQRLTLNRVTLRGSDPRIIHEFFVDQLGFRPRERIIDGKAGEIRYLFRLGKLQVEVLCREGEEIQEDQAITIATSRMALIRKWLTAEGIEPDEYREDPYTGMRFMEFTGPDRIHVRLIEEEWGSL